MIILVFVFTTVTHMGVIPSVITIFRHMADYFYVSPVCQASPNKPMEIFGIIILVRQKPLQIWGRQKPFSLRLLLLWRAGWLEMTNDFMVGHILHTDPKAQWIGEVVGGMVGGIVSVLILFVILKAYGPEAFGSEMFPAAQASAVAAMVGGISNMTAFIIGLIAAAILYCVNFPVITLGLGVYLPFYMSATAAIGGAIRFITDRFAPSFESDGKGTIIASGLLGGESIVGVIIAIYYALQIIA